MGFLGKYHALFIGSEGYGSQVLPRMIVGEQVLVAVLDPLHRTRQLVAGQHSGQFLRASIHLQSKRSADVGHDHPHPGVVEPEQTGEQAAGAVGALRREPDDELVAVAVPTGENSPSLHRHRRIAVLAKGLGHHQWRRFEDRLYFGILWCWQGGQEVRVPIGVDERRGVGKGLGKIDQRILGLDLDHHRFDPVLGQVPRVGDNHHYGLTHAPDIPVRQDPPGAAGVVLVVDQIVVDERGQVAGHVDGADPRNGGCRGRVDREDPAPGHIATDEGGVKDTGHVDVVDVLAMSRKEAHVFLASYPLPHETSPASHHLGHVCFPLVFMTARAQSGTPSPPYPEAARPVHDVREVTH